MNGAVPLGETKFTVSGALGYQQVKGPLDYTTWNVGVGFALTDHVAFDVRYWDTNVSNTNDPLGYSDGRVVGGIKLVW